MATKTAIIQKIIGDTVYDLMFKTTASNVYLEDGSTVDSKIEEISSHIANIVTENIIDSKIDTASNNLYNRIMGLSGSDVTINEAYDTIKEIADWLANNENATAASIISDIATLQGKVETLEQAATKVTDSEINGNIIVDGKEVEVYKHPETHSVDEIVETEEKQFVSQEEIDSWNAKSVITIGEETPETMEENDYFLKTVQQVDATITCEGGTASKQAVSIDSGSSVYVEFTPDDEYAFSEGDLTVTVGESSYEVDYTGKVCVLVKNITEDTEINVTFSEKPVVSVTSVNTNETYGDIVVDMNGSTTLKFTPVTGYKYDEVNSPVTVTGTTSYTANVDESGNLTVVITDITEDVSVDVSFVEVTAE